MISSSVPARMRSVVITGPRCAEVRTVETPTPGPRQALIRVEGSGLCGSNLPIWEGRPWFQYPNTAGNPGHEGWGRVVALGRDARGVELGDRVAFLSDRAFAELDVAGDDAIVKLPPALDGVEVPGEPLGCVMNIWRRGEVRPGDAVAVIGVGFLGAMLCQLAAAAGARVIALSQRPYSLALARRMGATETIDLARSDREIIDRVEDITAGQGCARVFEAVGLQRPLDLAGRLCQVRGRLIIVGFHQDGARTVDVQLWNWRGLDVINAHERDPGAYVDGMRAAVDGLATGRIDPAPLYTHRVPLAEAPRAFELLRTRPDGFVKALVIA